MYQNLRELVQGSCDWCLNSSYRSIHQEEVEKWTQEINDLRGLDSANEVVKSRLQNIQHLLKDVHG